VAFFFFLFPAEQETGLFLWRIFRQIFFNGEAIFGLLRVIFGTF